MVAAATGKSYARELHQRVFAPLGLRRTPPAARRRAARPYVHGYQRGPAGTSGRCQPRRSRPGGRGHRAGLSPRRAMPTPSSGRMRAAPPPALRCTGRSSRSGPEALSRRARAENSAGLAIFRYQTRCGTVYGHTGNTSGYTQFSPRPKTEAGQWWSRSTRRSPRNANPARFPELRRIYTLAVCAALAR